MAGRVKGKPVADISYKKAKTRAKEMGISIDTYIENVKKNGLTVGPKPAQAPAAEKTPADIYNLCENFLTKARGKQRDDSDILMRIKEMEKCIKALKPTLK